MEKEGSRMPRATRITAYLFLVVAVIVGLSCIYYPRSVKVNARPEKVIFHSGEGVAYEFNAESIISICAIIDRFFIDNQRGWHMVFRLLSLWETAPSIQVIGADQSYILYLWHDRATLGFPKTGKSYNKSINLEYHANLVAMLREANRPEEKRSFISTNELSH